MNKSNNFNLLRFIFASLVIVSHAHELKDGSRANEILTEVFGSISLGELAVDGFFILSGYLILKSWTERPSVVAFLSSRILRIYPGFIVASLVCALIVAPVYGQSDYFSAFSPLGYLRSLVTLKPPEIPPVFKESFYASVNGAMWSISYEFFCYMLVLGWGVVGIFRRKYLWLLLAVICLCVHVANRSGQTHLPYDRYFRCVMAFSVGGSFYLFHREIPWRGGLAILAFLISMLFLYSKTMAEVGLSVFLGYSIIYFAHHGKSLLYFNRIPDMSYGIYLYAWPINKILYWHMPSLNAYAAMALVFLLSACCGALSWYLVEKPSLKLKSIFRARVVQSLA